MEPYGSRTFEDLAGGAGKARDTLAALRKFCLSLGPDVVEHVRMHRVVFGKSMAMRWFVDLSPDGDSVKAKVNVRWHIRPKVLVLRAGDDMSEAHEMISAAYARA